MKKISLIIAALSTLVVMSCEKGEDKLTVEDFYGYWDCSAYNVEEGKTEEAYNLIIEEHKFQGKPGVIVKGWIDGEPDYFNVAMGYFNEKNQVIDLYSDWFLEGLNYYYTENPDVTYYSVFRVIYYDPQAHDYYFIENGNTGKGIASLKMDKDGSMTLVRGPKADPEGRYANGFLFEEFNASTKEYYRRSNVYYRVNFTKAKNPPVGSKAPIAEGVENVCMKSAR